MNNARPSSWEDSLKHLIESILKQRTCDDIKERIINISSLMWPQGQLGKAGFEIVTCPELHPTLRKEVVTIRLLQRGAGDKVVLHMRHRKAFETEEEALLGLLKEIQTRYKLFEVLVAKKQEQLIKRREEEVKKKNDNNEEMKEQGDERKIKQEDMDMET